MQTKSLLLTVCLLATSILQASSNPISLDFASKLTQVPVNCNVPPPGNFHVVSVGSTAAKVAWAYQPDAFGGYRLRTYRASDNVLISTILKGQDQLDATINGLQTGEEYYCIINSRCADGENSELQLSITFITPILELIVVGYSESHGGFDCGIQPNSGYCEFSITEGGYFKIYSNDGPSKNFNVHKVYNQYKYTCELENNPLNRPLYFSCPGPSGSTPPSCTSTNLTVTTNGLLVADFTVEEHYSMTITPRLKCTYLKEGYYIDSYYPTEFKSPSSNRSALSNSVTTISPNPFSESLNVFPSTPTAESIHLQLFNLSGQKVLDQQFPGGQEQYSLPTTSLSPGFYLLRVEADGNVQTLKVIKSE